MAIEFGSTSPWLDNWPVYQQLWQSANGRSPGEELDLSVATGRMLTAQWRNSTGTIVYASNEASAIPAIAIEQAKRGVVVVRPTGGLWDVLKAGETYTLEIVAYGVLYSATPYTTTMPAAGEASVNGMVVYGAPRQILELLGMIPGASVQVSVPLDGLNWTQDARGYWTASLAGINGFHGFWVDDHFAPNVPYAELALGSTRAWTTVGSTIYYKGFENLTLVYCEGAFSRYVLRCLEEATAEVERRTGRKFGLWRYTREVHRGLRRSRQIVPRQRPLVIDDYFRLDALSYSRTLFRRYTEKDFRPQSGGGQLLHGDAETGVITINQNAWDFWDWGNASMGDIGNFATLPPGENNIEITYTAGHAKKLPTDVDEAASNLAGIRQGIYWQQALTQGLQGISIGCVNLNFGQLFSQYTPAWQASAYQILDAYTRPDIEIL